MTYVLLPCSKKASTVMSLGNYIFFSSKTVEKSMLITDTNNQFKKFRCLFFKLLVIFKEVFKITTF